MNLLRNSYVTIFYLFWCCTDDLVVYLSGYVHSASIICCMQYVTTSLNAHFTITRVINIVQSHRLVHISIAHDAVTFNMLVMCVSTRAPSVCVVPDFLMGYIGIFVRWWIGGRSVLDRCFIHSAVLGCVSGSYDRFD